MPQLRLAHITDLHCNATEAWKENFKNVVRCLQDNEPDLIVITGDCVDNPIEAQYLCLVESVEDLYKKLVEKKPNLFLLTIPGNHDRYIFGNRIPLIPRISWRRDIFEEFQDRLIYPNVDTLSSAVAKIYDKFGVAIFPIDSTKSNRISFAQGRVDDPHNLLAQYSESFRSQASSLGRSYEESIKILLIHHHTIPLPANNLDQKIEAFNLIRNPYEFLHAVSTEKIDLILNGHRHVSGIAELKILSQQAHPITISACGSTAKIPLGRDDREIKFIDINASGASTATVYVANESVPNFTVSESNIPLLSYKSRREKRYQNAALYDDKHSCVIEKVYRKSKTLQVTDQNVAFVQLSLQGIRWVRRAGLADPFVYEHLFADIGRINRIRGSLVEDNAPANWQVFSRETFGQAPAPDKPEHVDFVLRPRNPIRPGETAICEIQYPLYNGYALTKTQYVECYQCNGSDVACEEACSLRSYYPTEILELVVLFPRSNQYALSPYFPDRNTIYVEAHKETASAHSMEADFRILKRQYMGEIDMEETEFLLEEKAIQVRPEIGQISLTVRHPQPKTIYTLRWAVPESMEKPKNIKRLQELRQLFAAQGREGIRFYDEVSKNIRLIDEDLQTVLIAYDENEKLLSIASSPKQFRGDARMYVGRGTAGTAFKMSRVEYYERDETPEGSSDILNYLEKITTDYNPAVILSLPLIYPSIIVDPEEGGQTQVIAVVSLISHDPESQLKKLNPRRAEKNGGLTELNEAINAFYSILRAAYLKHVDSTN